MKEDTDRLAYIKSLEATIADMQAEINAERTAQRLSLIHI